MNAVEIEEAVSKLVEEPFDPEEFPYQFLAAFGNKDTTIRRLRSGTTNKSDVADGVLQRNNIHIAVCEKGLVEATLPALRESPATASQKVKYILATDGESIEAESLEDGETLACSFTQLGDHFGFFLPLAGITTVKQIRENAFDIKATGRLNKLYIELLKANPGWEERREDLNHFFARIIFCFFAEDTGIINEDLFTTTVANMSEPSSANTHEVIAELFRAMNTKRDEREDAGIRNWARPFPYVNGGLFSGSLDVPTFTKMARSYLLHIGGLDWKQINPDIFGSMIQAVAEDEERGELGMHYTSVPNILKVLNPLFLDELREKLGEAGDGSDQGSKRKLLNLRNRIARIRVFDPACGSGNFLVIAYKHMREIEAEINRRRGESDRPSDIPLTNFRGIEIRHFAAEIARLALIIAEYQCDVLYRGQKLALAEFLPLEAANWITHGNALRLDWNGVCPRVGQSTEATSIELFDSRHDTPGVEFENIGGEVYLCGNPPYSGSREQSREQKNDMKSVFSPLTNKWKALDYVAAWFVKASGYLGATPNRAAFVATNSVCQGQQVPMLWSILLKDGVDIIFAHDSFRWTNLAAKNAGVTVVVIGIAHEPSGARHLYQVDPSGVLSQKAVPSINGYLVPGGHVLLDSASKPLNQFPSMAKGSYPVDGGHLLLNSEEVRQLLNKDAASEPFVRRFKGSSETIRGIERYCIWIRDSELDVAMAVQDIRQRIDAVRQMRLASRKPETRDAADMPHRFFWITQDGSESHAVVLPVHSSSSREYLPAGLLPAGTIVYGSAFAMFEPPMWAFAILVSRLQMAWASMVCGKIKTDVRYSNTLGWNIFPSPPLTEQNRKDLTRCAVNILIARESYWPATIADMYDPDEMDRLYPDLRAAHEANDETLERIYIGRRFKNDTERLEKLFAMYTEMIERE